jgi:hypothetical protein
VFSEGEGDNAAVGESDPLSPELGAMMAGRRITSLVLVGDEVVDCWYGGRKVVLLKRFRTTRLGLLSEGRFDPAKKTR